MTQMLEGCMDKGPHCEPQERLAAVDGVCR